MGIFIKSFISILFFLSTAISLAQEQEKSTFLTDDEKWDFSIYVGTLFPSNFHGIFESRSGWGGAFSFPSRYGQWEAGLFYATGDGDRVYHSNLGLKWHVYEYDPVLFIADLAGNMTFYKREQLLRDKEFQYGIGGHLGFGMAYKLTESLYLRSHFKLNFGPGRNLYVLIGLMVR